MGSDPLYADVVAYDDVQQVIDDFETEHEEIAEVLQRGDTAYAEALAAACEVAEEYQLYLRALEFKLVDGETAIRDDFFVEYCRQLLEDTGDLPRDLPPYIVIDWEATADNLRVDYSSVTVGGDEYWVR